MPVRDYDGNESKMLVLGQVTELQTQNRWHENPGLKNYIKRRGELPNLTGVGDVTTGKVQVVGTYAQKGDDFEKARMSTPAGSGLQLHIVERSTIFAIMKKESNIGYIGRFYGPGDLPAPVVVRHFGDFDQGGTGEAYMGGVFGPSGSGKTVLALELDALWARSGQMGMLFLDPKGEIAGNRVAEGGGFDFDFHAVLRTTTKGAFNPARDRVRISDVKLDERVLRVPFERLLRIGQGCEAAPEAPLV